ncbi:[protein-PII] uridylyltransferase [Neisseriaceae bacterium PsAf]|nr:[protein-PII] uridylyltransferase [Neisseriaceae bacterium PsAf]MCV2502918.1 [protein-PII] uridylyltransferase [Neisseriaceae bacterium]
MQEIIDKFKQKQQTLYENFKKHDDPYRFFEEYSETTIKLLKKIWYLHSHGHEDNLCLIAVGGFGRGELYPYSDIDLAIITQKKPNLEQENFISDFISTLWDIGLSPSMTVGTVEELFHDAKNEITKETSFLETEYILGNPQLLDDLLNELNNRREIVDFIEAKLSEMQARHDQFKGAAKQLEPDVKNTPGGLRDIHTLLWIAKAQGLQPDVNELTKSKIITKDEANLIINSHQNLARIRIHLHMLAHKNENYLFFNYHNDIAQLMHCNFPEDPHQNGEQMMQIFYRSTKLVRQLMGILIPMLKRRVYVPYPRKVFQIDKNYYQVGNLIACNDISIFTKDPTQILQIITYLQKNRSIVGIAPKTLRAWWLAIQNIDASFSESSKNKKAFIHLFKYGHGIFQILQYLNLYGFLEKYIPGFGRIVGLLQNDLFHIYPVDDHILTVVYYLVRLENENFIFEAPFASTLMSSYKNKYILYLAAFFHDIGKGRGGGHEIIGAQIARQFCDKHHLNESDTDLIVWLVKNHLIMSITAQKKDIGDYSVIKEFSEIVKTPERLVALYLLTISDIRGTNPTIWNNWKSNLLYQLFTSTLKILQDKSHLELEDIVQKQTIISQLISENSQYKEKITQFANSIDDSFFNTQTFDDIRWQINEITHTTETAFFDFRFLDEITLACIIFKPSSDNLMLTLCKIFAHLHLNIIRAKAFMTKDGWVLNKFIVAFPFQCLPSDVQRITKQLEHYLTLVLNEEIKEDELSIPEIFLTRRSLHSNIVPKVIISQEDYHNQTQDYFIISLVTINRNALLANIVELFNQYQIEIISISIHTLGESVEDSFLVKSNYLSSTKNRMLFKNKLLTICSL